MANVCILQGQASDGVKLLAAATEVVRSIGMKIEPELQEPYDKALAEARQSLSEEEFQSAWDAGKKMDIEHVVQFASEK